MTGREAEGASVSLEPEALLAALEAELVGPNVVAIGGGSGLARALSAISRYAGRIHAVVTVADDGPGISTGNAAQVFEPFFTTRRDMGGTGMGLAIVQTLLLAHGGQIAGDVL